MTDTITPASLRAHADWFDATFEPGSVEARSLRNCAARLEAEAARDEYVETLADVLAVAEGGAHLDQLQGWRQTGLRDGIRAVLDRLAADGRLLPEGGMVLDAGQVRDVNRILADLGVTYLPERLRGVFSDAHDQAGAAESNDSQNGLDFDVPPAVPVPDSGKVLTDEQWALAQILIAASHRKPEVQHAADRLRDEFKVGRCRCGGLIAEPSPGCEWHAARDATPPAVSVSDSAICGEPGPRGSACIEKRGHSGGHFAIENVPDSSEPELCPSTHHYYTCTRELGHEGQHEANDGRIVARSWPAEPAPDSGPDGTPEKPWPTWQDVPDGVRYQSQGRAFEFVNRDGVRLSVINGRVTRACILRHEAVNSIAPFVRVDGDKA